MKMPKINIKRILFIVCWSLLGAGTITLLVSAYAKNQSKICTGLYIQIDGPNNHFFVDKNDVLHVLEKHSGKKIKGKLMSSFKLRKIANELEVNPWISKAILFFDAKGLLHIELEEREPVARIFSNKAQTFYLDYSGKILPLSTKHLAQVPIFTGFQGDPQKLTKQDSCQLKGVLYLSSYIQKDSFLIQMIDQIHINNKNQYELIPSLGKQEVLFGDTSDMYGKFKKFSLFYKKAMSQNGWNKYGKLDLTFKNQIVAKLKNSQEVTADSLRAIQIMKTLSLLASKMAEDTTNRFAQDIKGNDADISLILQSLPRDYETDESSDSVNLKPAPVIQPPSNLNTGVVKKKTVINKPVILTKKKQKTLVSPKNKLKPKPVQKTKKSTPQK